jgi:protein farnesyltransferase/geranylgeranyltransferase type-1 subunit alpha
VFWSLFPENSFSTVAQINTNNPTMEGKYSSDPEWASIKPIELNDGSDSGAMPLATISYSPEYLEATSYLRAVMAANEMSERALRLTGDIISMNPAHYTVW